MNYDQIKELIAVISDSNVTTFEMESEGIKLKLQKDKEIVAAELPRLQVQAAPAAVAAVPVQPQAVEVPVKEEAKDVNLTVVTSPIVGTFYASSSPDSPAFVKVGDTVKKGQILCIIEAMKLMNEIEAEVEGTIAEICVVNEQMVEYNQPLFKIKAV